MPLYSYECENCGAQFERRQGFDDEPVRVCPECKKKAVHRVITAAGVIFKGSGFYSTDNKGSSSSKSTSSAKDKAGDKTTATSDTKSDSGSNGKSDSTPAKAAASSSET